VYVGEQVLLLALELSDTTWRVCFGSGTRQYPAAIEPGDGEGFEAALVRARTKLGLPAGAPVVSCYEAGRDAFWVHRWLTQRGVHNVVVDSSSIEVKRRGRQVKTDRLDARKLLGLLQRWYGGEASALAVVRVPSVAEEDARRLHREREFLVRERTREGNRLKGLLATQGVRVKGEKARWGAALDRLRTGDGEPLPPRLREELGRGVVQLQRAVGIDRRDRAQPA
jgi:transposase